jgi:hypothetical protein
MVLLRSFTHTYLGYTPVVPKHPPPTQLYSLLHLENKKWKNEIYEHVIRFCVFEEKYNE